MMLGKTGAGGGPTLAKVPTCGISMVPGRRNRLTKWWSTAAMVAAVMVSKKRPVEGGAFALSAESQEVGLGRVVFR